MAEPIETLILDLLEWISKEERSYSDLMAAWRTSCPRLPVWEEAVSRGFVHRENGADGVATVILTGTGRAFLKQQK
jgi:D-3-phosphoglycerate dehydrogenase / 2-oxoglutarate reductase